MAADSGAESAARALPPRVVFARSALRLASVRRTGEGFDEPVAEAAVDAVAVPRFCDNPSACSAMERAMSRSYTGARSAAGMSADRRTSNVLAGDAVADAAGAAAAEAEEEGDEEAPSVAKGKMRWKPPPKLASVSSS